jgi:hypothetical protein
VSIHMGFTNSESQAHIGDDIIGIAGGA